MFVRMACYLSPFDGDAIGCVKVGQEMVNGLKDVRVSNIKYGKKNDDNACEFWVVQIFACARDSGSSIALNVFIRSLYNPSCRPNCLTQVGLVGSVTNCMKEGDITE
eukprot:15365353-Ditylum_brightwellii.AAC.1